MILKEKNCLIFAANGMISRAVAHAFGSAGANLFLSSRDNDRLLDFADNLADNESKVSCKSVDATDPEAVESYIEQISREVQKLDVVFNGIGLRPADAKYGTVATDLDYESFKQPFSTICGAQFLTSRSAARVMQAKGGGSIILLSASLSGLSIPMMAGITAACGATEAMMRSLAAEFGPLSIRVNTLRADGMPETRTIQETTALMAQSMSRQSDGRVPENPNDLPAHQQITLKDTAKTAVFLVSDLSAGINNQVINVTGGRLLV